MQTTARLETLLHQLGLGQPSARDALLAQSLGRIQLLARSMFRGEHALRAFDQTDDVVSRALLRLHQALAQVCPPNVRAFYGLAAQHIRWVLQDLAREHAVHRRIDYRPTLPEPIDDAEGPADLAEWTDFHAAVQALPAQERELFDLVFYQGLDQAEAAQLLDVPLRTLKRSWRNARLLLRSRMAEDRPGT